MVKISYLNFRNLTEMGISQVIMRKHDQHALMDDNQIFMPGSIEN